MNAIDPMMLIVDDGARIREASCDLLDWGATSSPSLSATMTRVARRSNDRRDRPIRGDGIEGVAEGAPLARLSLNPSTEDGATMKIVVIGGSGLIGSKTVAILRRRGHEVVAAAPNTGVNTITGEGLAHALAGAHLVVDLANSPSFEDKAVLEFFRTSERNLLAAETSAGVRRHVALSIVAIDRTDNGYFRAKLAQEKLIEASGIPCTIVRSTQFMEFLGGIADSSMVEGKVRVPPVLFQPIAADDVASFVAAAALDKSQDGLVEIAGPERAPLNEFVARYLKAIGDPRQVVGDPQAPYWGAQVGERSLVPLGEARLGRIGLDEWLLAHKKAPQAASAEARTAS